MQVPLSMTIPPADPREVPAAASESKSIRTSHFDAGRIFIDDPPGTAAFSGRSECSMPPAYSFRSSRNGTPSGASNTPGRFTWPDRQNSFGPVFLGGRPMEANQAAPRSAMRVTLASVSTLLMMVGQPDSPTTAGNGGLMRG